MDFGVMMFCTDEGVRPDELARMAEDRGFESLFVPEHTHIPAARATPYPGGGELPREYARTLDPFVALTAAAAATSTLRLATGICLVIQRDPILLAKQVASLDHLSGGRFELGVGAGWNEEEMRDHGTDPRRRFAILRERVEAMKALWTADEASYAGHHVAFDRALSWPKPVQRPHPPILLGGNGPKVLERVVDFADEWLPNRIGDDDALIGRMEDLQRLAAGAGRDRIPVTLYGATRDPGRLARYAEAGVHRCVFILPTGPRDVVEPRLDAAAETRRALSG